MVSARISDLLPLSGKDAIWMKTHSKSNSRNDLPKKKILKNLHEIVAPFLFHLFYTPNNCSNGTKWYFERIINRCHKIFLQSKTNHPVTNFAHFSI